MSEGVGRPDASNGYDRVADDFHRGRSPVIGVDAVRGWASQLPRGARVLDLGCGDGVPLTETIAGQGLRVIAADASTRMLAALRRNVPRAEPVCAIAQRLPLRTASVHGALAWGVVFLLPPEAQEAAIDELGRVVAPGGRALFTAPWQIAEWPDSLTGLRSESLGADAYRTLARSAGFSVAAEFDDEGENHYYELVRVGESLKV